MEDLFTANKNLLNTDVKEIKEVVETEVEFAKSTKEDDVLVDEHNLPLTDVSEDTEDPSKRSGGGKGLPDVKSGDDKGPPKSGNGIPHNTAVLRRQ